MSTPEPLEQLRQDIASIQSSVGSLHTEVRLANARDSVEDLQTNLGALPQRIRDLRTRGYVFEKALEKDVADLAQTWAVLRPAVDLQIERQATALQQEMRPLEALLNALVLKAADPAGARPLVAQLKSSIGNLESKVRAAASSVSGMYDGLQSQYNQLNGRLAEDDWMLKHLAEASFRLLATEAGIAAVKAVWVQGGKEDAADPKGVLYVTDQRLIFEQKQEVATKKVLFITTEKQKVQQLGLEVPLGLIENVKASKQGLFGHEDHLDLKFGGGASVDAAHFHIDGQDSNRWQGLLGRAKAGDYDQDRVTAVDQAQVARVKSAPTVCPRCGAAMTAPVLRGVDSIKCEYCGNVVRL